MVKKKTMKKVKKVKKVKKTAKKAKGPKVIGKVEHFFGNISVAAMKLKSPLKIGDAIHVKGHTTDFTQRIDSIQINHKNVEKAKKGQDVGFKVKMKCRVGDTVCLAASEKAIPTQPALQKPAPFSCPTSAPQKSDPYANTKFIGF